MGQVYKARDTRLDRIVAIKVAKNQFSERFEREARIVAALNHPHICHLYDVGPDYLVIEFIEGRRLKGPCPVADVTAYAWQILDALEAAHAKGIVHRDLKPGNILVSEQGVKLLDFGLAKLNRDAAGTPDETQTMDLTRTGTVIGTPAYMAPEQWTAAAVDARSDIYAFGCILYELLTGKQVGADRKPVKPAHLERVVSKCLARNPGERWQSATEIKRQLKRASAKKRWTYSIAATAILAFAASSVVLWRRDPAKPHSPVTILIADFTNNTADPVFSGTLESTLKLVLEGGSFISAYDRTRMRDLGLPSVSGALDESKAQEIAANQGLNVVVSGALERRGADYELSLRAIQTVTGKVLANAAETVSGKGQVLFAVTKLGTTVRKALGDDASESTQRLSMETLSATSLEAIHEYAAGLDTLSSGKDDEAYRRFSQAVDLDSNFGLEYAGMAITSNNLGRPQDAEKYIKVAITHIDRMTERERFRTRALLFLLIGDAQKCVDEYGALLARYPADTGAYNNTGSCLIGLHNFPKALEEMRRAVAILPKRATYHVNLSIYSSFAGDFQTAAKEADVTLALNPSFAGGFALAFAKLGQGQLTQAAAAYRELETIRSWDAANGLADLALYEGRFGEAVTILQKGAAADQAARRSDDAAYKFALFAYTELLRHEKGPALEAAKSALGLSKRVKTRFLVAQVFAAAGEVATAQALAAGLGSETQIYPQAYAKLIEGEAALKNGDAREAVKLFSEANRLSDTWIGRYDLGRAYLEMGAFTEADSEFDRCIQRRGEALSLFLDPVPTHGYFPLVFYYQGRAREGMKTVGFRESYKQYLKIRGMAGEDPLLTEVRRRSGG
jgi:tetratricopeptide (TPR) repeat protein